MRIMNGYWVILGLIKATPFEDFFPKSQIERKKVAKVGFKEIKNNLKF